MILFYNVLTIQNYMKGKQNGDCQGSKRVRDQEMEELHS